MTYEDQILTEQNFPYKNLKYDERSFYLNLILNSKELCDRVIWLHEGLIRDDGDPEKIMADYEEFMRQEQ